MLTYRTQRSCRWKMERFASWRQSRRLIYAPDILLPEAVSVIRRSVYERWITEAEGKDAVEDVFRLGVEVVPSDAGLCQAALVWVGRLGSRKPTMDFTWLWQDGWGRSCGLPARGCKTGQSSLAYPGCDGMRRIRHHLACTAAGW